MKVVSSWCQWVFFLLVVCSCSRTNKQLQVAEGLIVNFPDSALSILNTYDYHTLSDKDKALYGLVYIQLRERKQLSLEPDSLLDFSLVYFEQNRNQRDRLGACYLYKGRILNYAQNYEQAMQYYLKAADELRNSSQNRYLGMLYFDMGVLYNMQAEYALSRQKFFQSIPYFKRIDDKESLFYAVIYIGRTYHEQKKYTHALHIYKQYSNHATDSLQKALLWQEIGLNYYDNKQYDSAIQYLKPILYYPYHKNNRAFRFQLTADLYFDINQIDSAIYYARNAFRFQPDIRTRKNCYRILSNSYSTLDKLDSVGKYMAKYQDCNDSIRKIDSQTKGSYLETMHLTQQELDKSRSRIWLLLFLLLVLTLSVWYVYRKKRRKITQLIQLKEQDHTQQKAEMRKDIMMKKRASLFAEIERIKAMQTQAGMADTSLSQRVLKLYSDLLHIQDVDLFFADMDSALNNIVSKLRRVCPDLSDKELMFCCLQLLQLPIHDLLILLNYESVNSLKGLKRRLAPKLALADASKLNDYLIELLAAD